MATDELKDFTMAVKDEINDKAIAWLYEASAEIEAQAKRTCVSEDDVGKRLKGSYKAEVDEGKRSAKVGTPLEEGYWEEWGTGEYAAHGDGRKGWWVYVKGQDTKGGGKSYGTREEAQEAADFLRRTKKPDAYVTNGRTPNYTLGMLLCTMT